MADIIINAQNSPYNIAGGSVSYGKVTIQTGGYMQMQQQTKLSISSLIVSSDAGTTTKASPRQPASKGRKKK